MNDQDFFNYIVKLIRGDANFLHSLLQYLKKNPGECERIKIALPEKITNFLAKKSFDELLFSPLIEDFEFKSHILQQYILNKNLKDQLKDQIIQKTISAVKEYIQYLQQPNHLDHIDFFGQPDCFPLFAQEEDILKTSLSTDCSKQENHSFTDSPTFFHKKPYQEKKQQSIDSRIPSLEIMKALLEGKTHKEWEISLNENILSLYFLADSPSVAQLRIFERRHQSLIRKLPKKSESSIKYFFILVDTQEKIKIMQFYDETNNGTVFNKEIFLQEIYPAILSEPILEQTIPSPQNH